MRTVWSMRHKWVEVCFFHENDALRVRLFTVSDESASNCRKITMIVHLQVTSEISARNMFGIASCSWQSYIDTQIHNVMQIVRDLVFPPFKQWRRHCERLPRTPLSAMVTPNCLILFASSGSSGISRLLNIDISNRSKNQLSSSIATLKRASDAASDALSPTPES